MSLLGELMRRIGAIPPHPPLIEVPLSDENAETFFARVANLLADPRTHVYLDTSMLMWLTKIGDAARSQLLDWLETNCRGRLHVPVWSAHEYLRHHVAKTVNSNLAEAIGHLTKAAGVYRTIHPYLDEALGTEDAGRQQSEARQVLRRTAELAASLDQWKKFYERHALQVLEFINRHCIAGTNVFDMMEGIETVGHARFAGRLPPGFRDKNKKESVDKAVPDHRGAASDQEEDHKNGGTVGHNRWGDLIFWRELLDHAKRRRAQALVILTNDRKNDWFMGGGTMAGITADMQRVEKLKPIPRPHPVLVAEARSAARISNVVLLDAPYAGLLLKRVAPQASNAFADVALVQKLAPSARPGASGPATDTGTATTPPPPAVAPTWKDADTLVYSRSKTRDALTQSRAAPSGVSADLVALADAALAAGDGISTVLTEEHLKRADAQALVTFAREVGDRARNGQASWISAASDLAGALMTIPHKTGGSLYLGLLAAAYLERTDNAVRLPPSAPYLSSLWDLRGVQHFDPAISSIRERLESAERRPIYVIGDREALNAGLEIDTNGEVATDLRQLRLGDQLLVQTPQFRADLRLRERADGAERAKGETIVKIACDVFGVPLDAVTRTADFDRDFTIRREIGFKDPAEIYISKPEAE